MEREIARWLEDERSAGRTNRVPVVKEGVVAVVDIDEYMRKVVNERRAAIAKQVHVVAAGPSGPSFVQPSAGMVRPATSAVLLDHAIGLLCEEERLRRLGRG